METQVEGGPRIIAFGSGKGGVGKSLLAANVGIFLATLGRKVILIDASFGAANLHTFIGVDGKPGALSDMLATNKVHLRDVVAETRVPGLGLISGRDDLAWAANPKSSQLARLQRQLRELDADDIVIDLGTGTRSACVDLFLLADQSVLVVTPEPPSVELGYRFLRAAFARRLRQLSLQHMLPLGDDPTELRYAGGIPSPIDFYRHAQEVDNDELTAKLKTEILRFNSFLVMNHVRSNSDLDLGRAMASAVRRVLGLPVRFFGHLDYDDAVWVSLRRGRPLLVEHPESRVAKCVEKITRRLLAVEGDAPETTLPSNSSDYDLLDVDPTASQEEIRRAHRRIKELYAKDSTLVRGLYTTSQLEKMNTRLENAHSRLMNPVNRKRYDQELFPGGIPDTASEKSPPAISIGTRRIVENVPLPPAPDIDEETEWNGELLQQFRQARGLELRDISETTKVGLSYLEALEDDQFDKLPAAVYLRGFLTEYTRTVGITGDQGTRAVDEYMARYRRERGQPAA